MDRLLDVSRPGGYPWCAEEIEIIEKRADYLNGLLDCLQLQPGSCVFIQRENRDDYSARPFSKLLVYIVPYPTNNYQFSLDIRGELFWLEGDSRTHDLNLIKGTVSRGIKFDPKTHSVEGTQGVPWDNCYKTNTAELIVGTPYYKFYDLHDLLRPVVWRDWNIEALQLFGGSGWTYASAHLNENYGNFLRTSESTLEVRLNFSNGNSGYTDDKMKVSISNSTDIPIPKNIVFPLNAMVVGSQLSSVYPCWIEKTNNATEIYIPKITLPSNANLYISGIVSLK